MSVANLNNEPHTHFGRLFIVSLGDCRRLKIPCLLVRSILYTRTYRKATPPLGPLSKARSLHDKEDVRIQPLRFRKRLDETVHFNAVILGTPIVLLWRKSSFENRARWCDSLCHATYGMHTRTRAKRTADKMPQGRKSTAVIHNAQEHKLDTKHGVTRWAPEVLVARNTRERHGLNI